MFHANLNTMRIIQKEEWARYPFAYNGCFGVSCNKKLIIGGGSYSNGQSTMKVYEESDSSSHQFKSTMPLNYGRTGASAVFSRWHRKLIIAGGTSTYLDNYTLYDLRNVELLDTTPSSPYSSSLESNRWIACKDKIPGIFGAIVEVFALKDKIILDDVENSKIYEGTIIDDPANNGTIQVGRYKWTPVPACTIVWASFPAMNEPRYNHTLIVLGDRLLLCIGGHSVSSEECVRTCEYFSYETMTWHIGPELPFCLQQAHILALDDEDEGEDTTNLRCIIIGGKRDHTTSPTLSLFDLEKGDIVNFKGTLDTKYALKESMLSSIKQVVGGPNRHVAVLL